LLSWFVFIVEHPLAGKWVPIPAGSFVMGMDEKEAEYAYQACLDGALDQEECRQSTPDLLLGWSGRQKDASLKEYSILENEVTFAQYRQCVEDGPCKELVDVSPENRGINLPATNLDWLEAQAYCEWLGGRLPTEAEWEKAARGSDGNYFPWGTPQTWDESKANIEHKGEGSVAKVFQFAETDLSLYGVINMAGNVREWTSTECSPESCFKKEGQKFSDSFMTIERAKEGDTPKPVIVRGGHWENARSQGIASQREFGVTNVRGDHTGFRCVCPEGASCETPWTWWWIWLRLH
jgi:formylglycine-generating enzyme required for sulfatase activity